MLAAADARFAPRPVPKLAAGALALGVHVLFVVMLVFGVSWQTQPAGPVSVDLWEALPAVPPPRPKPPPAPPPEPVKAAPAKPVTAPKVAETPPPKAPDIALEKKKAEEKRRAEATVRDKQLAEQKRIEAQRREQQRQQEEAEIMRRMADAEAAEAATLTQQAEARAEANRRQAAARSVAQQYAAQISAKVRGNTRLPANLTGNPLARVRITVLPTGEVRKVTWIQSSGNPLYDEELERAILKSSPLPLPADSDARKELGVPELSLAHRP
ncbi:MAG: energy transducer TonB [Pseudomonadota bacterium]